MVTYEAITIDSRFMWRAQTPHGYYWKTFDIFTQGEDDYQRWHIDKAYASGDVSYPFWAHPIPKFISNQGGTTPADLSYVATLPLGGYSFDLRGRTWMSQRTVRMVFSTGSHGTFPQRLAGSRKAPCLKAQ